MNTQVSSIALLKTVIPASEAILSGKDFLGQLRCLRAIDTEIAGLISPTSITADKRILRDPHGERLDETDAGRLTLP
jgi:hypothetical protein